MVRKLIALALLLATIAGSVWTYFLITSSDEAIAARFHLNQPQRQVMRLCQTVLKRQGGKFKRPVRLAVGCACIGRRIIDSAEHDEYEAAIQQFEGVLVFNAKPKPDYLAVKEWYDARPVLKALPSSTRKRLIKNTWSAIGFCGAKESYQSAQMEAYYQSPSKSEELKRQKNPSRNWRKSIDYTSNVATSYEINKRNQQSVLNARYCKLSNLDDKLDVLDVRALLAGGLSSVGFGDASEPVKAAEIYIQSGVRRLAVVLEAHEPTIWKFTGHTDRVSRVFINDETRNKFYRTGVVGVASDKVSFFPKRKCFGYVDTPSLRAHLIRNRIGQKPAKHILVNDYTKLALPSGKYSEDEPITRHAVVPPSKDANELLYEAYTYHKGGLVKFQTSDVISKSATKHFEPLPHNLGLAQLVARGNLRVIGREEHVAITAMGPNLDPDGTRSMRRETRGRFVPDKFLILKPIVFPIGLCSVYKVKFVLGKGVAMPMGDPCDSEIVHEDTLEKICIGKSCGH